MITHLVDELLDEQLIDRKGQKAGRIDGIVLQWQPDRAPVVAFVEVSPITLIARLSRRLARLYAPIDRRFGEGRGRPFRVEWRRLRQEKHAWRFNGDLDETPINALEDWLRVRIIERAFGKRAAR